MKQSVFVFNEYVLLILFAVGLGWGRSGLENRWSERACTFESCLRRYMDP